MNSEEMDKVLARLRKMLAMANDKANIHESAVAAAMAEKLMRKYQIEMADVLISDEGFSARDVNQEFEWCGNSDDQWKQWIAVGLAKLNECGVQWKGTKNTKGFLFIGIGPDPTVASEMYRYLHNEVKRLAKIHGGGRAAMNSFEKGCGSELNQRLIELRDARQQEFAGSKAGTALVIHKEALLRDAGFEFSYGAAKQHSASDTAAYHNGRRAARDINLSDQISGTRNDKRIA